MPDQSGIERVPTYGYTAGAENLMGPAAHLKPQQAEVNLWPPPKSAMSTTSFLSSR